MIAGAHVRPRGKKEKKEHKVLMALKAKIEMLKNWKDDVRKTVPLVLQKLEKFAELHKQPREEDEFFSFVRSLQNSVSFDRNPK
jgi:hypothetical protein